MRNGTILYIGGFELPDKNAAALRVLSNAKAFRELGYDVIFINSLKKKSGTPVWVQYEGFACYEYQQTSLIQYLTQIHTITNIIKEYKIDIVIAYNYPAIALYKLSKYCEKYSIQCMADITEWYDAPKKNLIFYVIKKLDTEFRMQYVHKKMDAVIVISDYPYQFYKKHVKTIQVPPLVDLSEEKWNVSVERNHQGLTFIYAGSPSSQKERLDSIVNVIEQTDINLPIRLSIIGISLHEFNEMYHCNYEGNKVTFYGRIPNNQVISKIKEANWSIILRDNSRLVQAGFPTKLVESISCGTPVIVNKFSNIEDYLNDRNSILIDSIENFSAETIKNQAILLTISTQKSLLFRIISIR